MRRPPAYVEELERRADTIEEFDRASGDLPTGDSLAAELTRFLRERERERRRPAPAEGDEPAGRATAGVRFG